MKEEGAGDGDGGAGSAVEDECTGLGTATRSAGMGSGWGGRVGSSVLAMLPGKLFGGRLVSAVVVVVGPVVVFYRHMQRQR